MNPIRALRQSEGQSMPAFAIRLGIGYEQLCKVEYGYSPRIPRGVLAALAAAGYDAEALQGEYARWRETQAQAMRATA